MKTLKTFQVVLVILVLSILVGCSDSGDPISSSGVTPKKTSKNNRSPVVDESLPVILPVLPTFRTKLRLKPYRSYTFNASNTGFAKFNSIDIIHISSSSTASVTKDDCSDLDIYGDSVNDFPLSCHSSGFDIKNLTVKNRTSRIIDLDVSLRGVKVKKVASIED